MARYQIIIQRPAEKELATVPKRDAGRMAAAIDALADAPRPRGASSSKPTRTSG